MVVTRLQAKRRKIERDEKVRILFDSALQKVDGIVEKCKQDVDYQLNLIRTRTDGQLLQMKFSDFLCLKEKQQLTALYNVSPYRNIVPKSVIL